MSDEATPVEVTEPEVAAEVPAPEAPPKAHPLEPGGERFESVYARMKEYDRERVALRERLAHLEGKVAATPPPQQQQQPRHLTRDELQTLVDRGQINPAAMAEQLAWQQAERAKQELRAELTQQQKVTTAQSEVREYMSKIPALADTSSDEFRKVLMAAQDVAEDMGLPVQDARVQRRALREAFGPVTAVAETRRAREFDRRAADTHTEVGRGGGSVASDDPLKNIPQSQLAYWQKMGYSREQMLAEAPYVRSYRSRQRG